MAGFWGRPAVVFGWRRSRVLLPLPYRALMGGAEKELDPAWVAPSNDGRLSSSELISTALLPLTLH